MTFLTGAHAQSTPYFELESAPGPRSLGSFDAFGADGVLHASWNGLYRRSLDRGRTWSPVAQPDPRTGSRKLAIAGPALHSIVSSANAGTWCTTSTDRGASWSAPVNVSSLSYRAVDIDAAGLAVHALLVDLGGAPDVHVRSLDGGAVWSTPLNQPGSMRGQLAVTGPVVHCAWVGANGIEYRRSLDQGTTWQSPTSIAPAGTQLPQLAAEGALTYIVYEDGGVTRCSRSTDQGATWSANPPAIPIPVTQPLAKFRGNLGAMAGGSLVAGVSGVTVALSTDFGATWQTTTFAIDRSPYARHVSDLAIDNGIVAVATMGTGYFGPGYICLPVSVHVSNDGGVSWSHSASFGQGFLPGGTAPRLLVDRDSRVLVWGNVDNWSNICYVDRLLATLVYGYQPYGTAKPGTGGIEPLLEGVGEPLFGNTVTVRVSRTVGGAIALIGGTFEGPANIVFGGGSILLAPPVVAFWGVASGLPGSAGAGAFAIQIAIPNQPALRGARLDFQGFAFDGAAVAGFSSTAGSEMWVF